MRETLARPLFLAFGSSDRPAINPWPERVRVVTAAPTGPWELPVIGTVAAPGAVLIRPDGYVAWAGGSEDGGLADALTKWFGWPR